MFLPVSPTLEIWVWLKGLETVMPLSTLLLICRLFRLQNFVYFYHLFWSSLFFFDGLHSQLLYGKNNNNNNHSMHPHNLDFLVPGFSSWEGLRSYPSIPSTSSPPREGVWRHNTWCSFHVTWSFCYPKPSPS